MGGQVLILQGAGKSGGHNVFSGCMDLGGQRLFFKMEMGGQELFYKIGLGGPILFLRSKMGGQRLFLDRKITDFPGDVPVNFGHSLMFFRPSLGIFLIFYCS